jgi:mannosyltransferase OCH1-like enzyme
MPETTLKPAVVSLDQGTYMVSVGRLKKPILAGEMNEAAGLRKLVGKEDVVAVLSGKTIAAIGRRIAPCYWIVCYIPAPEIFQQIRPEIRKQLVTKYVNEGIIDKQLAKEIQAGF